MNKHTQSPFKKVGNMDSLQVGSRVETRTLSVRPEALTVYPRARSPITGLLIGLDDAILTCIGTIANADDFATTSTPASRDVEARVNNGLPHVPALDHTLHAISYCPHSHPSHRIMERVFHHIDVWTSTFQLLSGADIEFCVIDEAEGHG